jgi:pyruvate-ferredoxin/flavodoxin oxidoreductase
MPEHGIPDEGASRAARLALESRAFPFLVYDPDAGPALSDRLDLQGNPALEDSWPDYELQYREDNGGQKKMTVPLTIADWAASEPRFARHFSKAERASSDQNMVPFHEYLELSGADRVGKIPFVYALDAEKRLDRLIASDEIVQLAEERLALWSDLKRMAGLEIAPSVREEVAADLQREYRERESVLRAQYAAKLSEQGAEQTQLAVKRIVTGLFGEAVASRAAAASRTEAPGAGEDLQVSPSHPDS